MKHRDDNCVEIENSLSLFVGGDLEEPAAKDVALHLETCRSCAAQAESARAARTLMVSALTLSERRGPELWPGVRERLVREGALVESGPRSESRGRRARRARFLPLTAAAAALAAGFWLARDAFDSHAPYGPGGDPLPNPIVEVESPVRPEVSITPVVLDLASSTDTGLLRRVGPGERPLSQGAEIYSDLPLDQGLSTFGDTLMVPVMLNPLRR